MPRRACILTLDPAHGGGVITLQHAMYRTIASIGHEPYLAYLSIDPVDRLTFRSLGNGSLWRAREKVSHGMRGASIAPIPPTRANISYLLTYLAFKPYLERCDYHVVVSGANHAALPAVLARKPFVLWIATVYEDEIRAQARGGWTTAQRLLRSPLRWQLILWQERLIFEKATLILATSSYTAHRIVERCPEAGGRVRVVPCPVDTDRFRPTDNRRRQENIPRYVLWVGRARDPRKNLPLLLQAFAVVKSQMPDLKLKIVGGPLSDVVMELVSKLHLEPSVIFEGQVSKAELISLYQGADALVVSSLQEGLGIVILEAYACGVPVVATRCGGPEGIVVDGETGYLVRNNDAKELALGVLELLQDNVLRARMGQNCVAFVRTHFARKVIERQLIDALADAFPHAFSDREATNHLRDTARAFLA